MKQNLSLEVFHKSAANVPAYRTFLSEAGINPSSVQTLEDFQAVPNTNKKNYLLANSLNDLLSPDAQKPLLFCSTSGSTGMPYYFPRDERLSAQYSVLLENFMQASSYGTGSTLVLLGFGMGVWIGGIITLRAFEIAGQRLNQSVAILPAGYNKVEIFKALHQLSPQFDQTIIVGYPPFIKELVDEAEAENVDLKKLQLRFLFAAEAFTETFRNYVCQKAGISDPHRDTLNIYGSADIGAMAYETPVSIMIRRLVLQNPLLCMDIFGQIEKTPTLAQFNPEFINFEAQDGEILLTGDGALPLIRYAIGDKGGVMDYNQLERILAKYDIDLDTEIEKCNIKQTVKQQPFVFIYERTDLSTTLHGINIYPEFIKEALLTKNMIPICTERFSMSTKNDIHHNQFLQINVELQKGIEGSEALIKQVLSAVRQKLIKKSSEFSEVAKSRQSQGLIQIVLWPNGHPRYFAPGTKQKWVEKV